MLRVNVHEPVLLEEIKKFISKKERINVIDATFGGGGYSRALLHNYNINELIAIDRDPVTEIFAKDLIENYNNFRLVNGCFSKIDELISLDKTSSTTLIVSLSVTRNPSKNCVDIFFDLSLSPI